MSDFDADAKRARIETAFVQASRHVLLVARQTKTGVVIWEDGRIRKIPWDQLDELERRLPPEESGDPMGT